MYQFPALLNSDLAKTLPSCKSKVKPILLGGLLCVRVHDCAEAISAKVAETSSRIPSHRKALIALSSCAGFERNKVRCGATSSPLRMDSNISDEAQRAEIYFGMPVEVNENKQDTRVLGDTTLNKGNACRIPARLARLHNLHPICSRRIGRKAMQTKKRRWVAKVKTDSTHPPRGLFNKSAAAIARSLASKKVSPKGPGSGMRMLTYYINRAGKGLSASRRRELEKAKVLLRKKVAVPRAPRPRKKKRADKNARPKKSRSVPRAPRPRKKERRAWSPPTP